jgi:hypothetical protein
MLCRGLLKKTQRSAGGAFVYIVREKDVADGNSALRTSDCYHEEYSWKRGGLDTIGLDEETPIESNGYDSSMNLKMT